ncbi:cation transporter [Methylolobus aquaticus]
MTPGTEITVRYRASGHARFELPLALCQTAEGARLTAALTPIEGVYRVDLYPRQRKLSVRFIESICSFQNLSEALLAVASGTGEHSCCGSEATARPGKVAPLPLRDRTGTGLSLLNRRQPAPAGTGLLARIPVKETTVVEFLNDVLVLFLIKLHWHMITQHWLREPWRYRYEWMAAIYMIYLLVRSRRPKS